MPAVPSQFISGVRPQVAPMAQPGPSGDAIMAEGLARAGATIEQGAEAHLDAGEHLAQLHYEQDKMQQGAAASLAFARLRTGMAQQVSDLRTNAAPGGAGHVDAVKAAYDPQVDALMNGISNPDVRQHMIEQVAQYGAELSTSEYQWQSGQATAKMVTDVQQASDLSGNLARSMTDPAAIGREIARGVGELATMPIGGDLRDKLTHARVSTVLTSAIEGATARGDTALAGKLLGSEEAARYLKPHELETLTRSADAEQRRVEAAARADQAHQRALLRDQLGALENDYNAGGGSVQDLLALSERWATLGDLSKAAEWKGKYLNRTAVQGSRDLTLPQMDSEISTMTAKQSGGGLLGPEAHLLAGLKEQRAQTADRLNKPGGALLQLQYSAKRALVVLDPHDPATFKARGADARAAALKYGRSVVQPLLETDLPALKDAYAQGPNGKLQVLGMLRQFGDPRTIAGAAAQVAGADDGQFRVASTLNGDVAKDVLRGDATLKDHPAVWNEKQASHDFAVWYGPVLSQLGGSVRDDVYKAARAFYAQRASDGGEQHYNPGRFAEAVETMIGRTQTAGGATGGVAHYGQGIAVVPRGVDAGTMQRTFARSVPQDYLKASGGAHPVWPDGHPMTEGEFKTLLPTMMADGRYGFRARDGGYVRARNGGPYTVDFSLLPRR